MKKRIVSSLLICMFATTLMWQTNKGLVEDKVIYDVENTETTGVTKPVQKEHVAVFLSEEEEIQDTELKVDDTKIAKQQVESNSSFDKVENTSKEESLQQKDTEDAVIEVNNKYSYCPVGINDNGSLRQFYCENKDSGVVSDHIYTSYNGSENIVLAPGSGWDSIHVCDPTVIEGNFLYQGVQYKYLMAYLGCNTTDCQNNQIGLAVSNSMSSGWVRVYDHPFISFKYDSSHADAFQWGVGQPSLVSIDNGGKVALFYTEGTWNLTSEKVGIWDFSNLDNPIDCGSATISNSGVEDFISNADFCYNPNTSTLYMVSDVHPFSGSVLSNVADASRVVSTVVDIASAEALGSCNWSIVKQIDLGVTGHQKNHNAGFIRDSFGHVGDTPDVLCTVADEKEDFLNSLWSYTIQLVDL